MIQRLLYNRRLNALGQRLEAFTCREGFHSSRLIKTKLGEPVYLVHHILSENNRSYGGFIHVITSKGFDSKLNYLIKTDQNKHIYVFVGDIAHSRINQGIGSQILLFLDEIAKSIGAKKITGWLSPVDLGTHKERLLYFYEKCGYQMEEGKVPELNVKGTFVVKYL